MISGIMLEFQEQWKVIVDDFTTSISYAYSKARLSHVIRDPANKTIIIAPPPISYMWTIGHSPLTLTLLLECSHRAPILCPVSRAAAVRRLARSPCPHA